MGHRKKNQESPVGSPKNKQTYVYIRIYLCYIYIYKVGGGVVCFDCLVGCDVASNHIAFTSNWGGNPYGFVEFLLTF